LYSICEKHPKDDFFFVQEGFLLKGMRLCVSKCSTCELLIREVHGRSSAGHYGKNKAIIMPRIDKDF